MKTIALFTLLLSSLTALGHLEVVSNHTPQTVFADSAQDVQIKFRNSSDQVVETNLRTRMYEASSSTLMPLEPVKPWKSLRILPGQTIIETFTAKFPQIRASTNFQIHWLDEKGNDLGHQTITVYPKDVLNPLKALAKGKPVGLFDPENQLERLFKESKIEFEDLLGASQNEFQGRLIVAIMSEERPFSAEISQRILEYAQSGIAVIWIRPIPDPKLFSTPTIQVLRSSSGTLVFTDPLLVSNLVTSPSSQQNLVGLAEIALNPHWIPLMPPSSNRK